MSAIELLKKAIEYDVSGRRMEALKLYQSGINSLLKIYKDETNIEKKRHFQVKIEEYMVRAEQLKLLVKDLTSKGTIVDKIFILDGARFHSYETVFGKYMDDNVKEISLEEPYLQNHHQICNLLRFLELAVLKCRNLKFVNVVTTKDNSSDQQNSLETIEESLKYQHIELNVEYSDTIHDRQIIFSNGYIIKIGRGLDYFKPSKSKFSLGYFNFELRECKQTNIDILFCEENKK